MERVTFCPKATVLRNATNRTEAFLTKAYRHVAKLFIDLLEKDSEVAFSTGTGYSVGS